MGVRRWFAAVTVASCFTLQDVKNEGCKVLCIRDGYTSGQYLASKDHCACIDSKKYDDLTKHRTSLGKIEMQPISEEDKAMGLVAPFRASNRKSNIFNTTPESSSAWNPSLDLWED